MDAWWTFGLNAIPVLQTWGTTWIAAMKALSFLGSEQVYMFILPLILWCLDAQLGVRLGILLLGSSWLNATLKLAAGLPRPYWVSQRVAPLAVETSYGLPSGHAQTTTAVYGGLATSLRGRWIVPLTLVLLFLIGWSRLVLGVHFAIDVITGWVMGAVLLWAFIRLEAPFARFLRRLTPGLRLSLPLLISLAMVAAGFLIRSGALERTLPAEWIMNAMRADPHGPPLEPRLAADFVNPAGTLFGFGTGALLLGAWGRFTGRGRGWVLVGRFALGLAGTLLIYYGLRAVLPSGESIAADGGRYLRYALVGFWLSYGAPRLFAWARLG